MNQILHFDLTYWVATIGYFGIFLVLFCETGLFFGCFFPGDSLLFTAGMLAERGVLHLSLLIPIAFIAGVLGYSLGYWFGLKLEPYFLKKKDGFFWKRKYLDQAHDFYTKYGGRAMILCRLVPIVRTFCPIVAGMAEMPWRRYQLFNLIGGGLWVVLLSYLGYSIGGLFPNARHFILPMVLVIIVISVLPAVIHYFRRPSA